MSDNFEMLCINPIQDRIFGECSWIRAGGGGGGQNHTHPTMTKLGTVIPCLRKIQKLYESRTHPWSFDDISVFLQKDQQILLYQ